MTANESTILDFIDNNRTVFIIPPFQRNYEWSKENCEELFCDIIESLKTGKTHYLSNFVYYETEDSSHAFRKIMLVDGQQRLTTILLLLSAIRDLTKDEELKETINDSYLYNKKKNEKFRLKLKQIEVDNDAFISIVEEKECNNKNCKIYENYAYLKALLEKSSYSLNQIFEAIGKLEVVDVDLQIKNDLNAVQTIFEKINSTGKPLTSADLIRNYLLISQNDEEQESLYKNYWRNIEKNINNEDEISNFAKDYLILQIITDVRETRIYKDFKKHFDSTNITHEEILRDMMDYSKYYSWILYSNSPNDQLNKYIIELKALETNDVYPLYIYLIKNLYSTNLAELLKIFNLLVCFLLRYRIVSPQGGSGDLRNTILKLINKLMTEEIKNTYEDILLALSNSATKNGRFPDDTDFKEALKKSQKYNHTYGAVLLRRIEDYETKNCDVDLDKITVEHFMPQTLDKKGWWKDNLGGDLQAMETQNLYLHCIGNLGIMSGPYNSKNSNKPWNEKVIQIKEVQFNVTRDVLKYNCWKKEQIIERNEDMANRACKAIISPLPRKTPFLDIEFESGLYNASELEEEMTGKVLRDVIFDGKSLGIKAWRLYFNEVCKITNNIDSKKFDKIVSENKIHKANSTYEAGKKDPIISRKAENLIEPLPIENTNYFSEGSLAANRAIVYARQLLDEFCLTDKIELEIEKKK